MPLAPIVNLGSKEPRERVDPSDLESLGTGRVIACDCLVTGAGTWPFRDGAYVNDRFVCIDHHQDDPRMHRFVSSANLAVEWVRARHGPRPDDLVVITHTDCDSVLSSGIVSGRLEPKPEYEDAAIAADHTGAKNAIADLLQSLDSCRDHEVSLRNLSLLERGQALDPAAQQALANRTRKREVAAHAVETGRIQLDGLLAFGVLDESIDGEFFPALLPKAMVILTAAPHRPKPWVMKLRLGTAAPPGMTLQRLGIQELDPAYGGRWNAGSNKRGGGTEMSPEVYARAVADRLRRIS